MLAAARGSRPARTVRGRAALGPRAVHAVALDAVALDAVAFDAVTLAVAAVAVSAVGIGRPSFWTDEAATISGSRRSLGELWRMLHHVDAVHGLYYLLMHAWTGRFGTSEVALRLPSALAVGLATAGVVVLARMLAPRRVALCAGVLFLVLPRVTWMAVEARSYALCTALAVWTAVLLVRALRRGGAWWVGYAGLLVLSTLLFLYTVLLLAAHAATVAWTCRGRPRRALPWCLSAAAVGALVAPFVLVAIGESGQITAARLAPVKTAKDVLLQQWFLGALPTQDQHAHLGQVTRTPWVAGAVALALVLGTLSAVSTVRALRGPRSRTGAAARPDGDGSASLVALALPWAVLPTVALLAVAVRDPVYNPRYLSFTVPAGALLAAPALAALRRTRTVVAALAGIAVLAAPVFVSQRGPYAKKRSDWAEVAAVLGDRAAPGDVVVHTVLSPRQRASSRKIGVAYPHAFADLRDVTLLRTGPEADDLWGRYRPLSAVMGRLRGVDHLWLVTDASRPFGPRRAPETAVLTRAGFAVAQQPWHGPATRVYLLRRTRSGASR